ncbi:AAA family ATPase [Stieleria sp. JC731]|uniref:AAA family ATPase n=1 Tax=Pirellulaceae TaxID=2691357 RepID=UPI001E595D0D|nr:AAA family ATPase [Stieleria sp. JC731]MCC9601010.1 AAA family ATPase [Stieleria sp. JC731]
MAVKLSNLKRLKLKNFTVFDNDSIEFSEKLNVIVGENGSGKTHLLKLIYCVLASISDPGNPTSDPKPTKRYLQRVIAEKLQNVFRPDHLGRLIRRAPGRGRCEVNAIISQKKSVSFFFNSSSKAEVSIDRLPTLWLEGDPIYLPTRELMTLMPSFVSLFETKIIPFDETYRDTCVLLGSPALRGPRAAEVNVILEPLEKIIGGKVETDKSGRFYVRTESGNLEMPLVAEGHRKLATIARLVATGHLVGGSHLIWDEPETNLNPAVVTKIAKAILQLCAGGVQVFIATHSLFLMRELDILLQSDEHQDVAARFIGLHRDNHSIRVEQGNSVDDVGEIVSLQAELQQTDRYLEVEAGDDDV